MHVMKSYMISYMISLQAMKLVDEVDPRMAGMTQRDALSSARNDDIPCELRIRYPTLQAIMSGRRNIQTTLVCHDIYIDI